MVERRNSSQVRSFRDLIAWQKSMKLAETVYQVTAGFPKGEAFGLVSQMRRSAVSIPSNIAEGQARNSRGELLQSLGHARGSLAELETQMLIATRLGYLDKADVGALADEIGEVGRLLNGLRNSLRRSTRDSDH
jgi:four helix bundle protein